MPKILILDDRKETRESYARALRTRAEHPGHGRPDAQWEVQTAATRQMGMKLLREAHAAHEPFDIVLTDLRMKASDDGLKLMMDARELDPSLLSILYTGQPRHMDREKAYDLNTFAIVHTLDPDIVVVDEFYYLICRALSLREQQQCLGALRRHVARPIYEALAKNPDGLPLRKQMLTVCFWDIRGFSVLTTQIRRLEVLSAFIKEYFRLAEETIARNGGILDKFIGDGVMALFGYSPDPSVKIPGYGVKEAAQAACDFEKAFEELVRAWLHRLDVVARGRLNTPKLGCGIHTGDDLVVGYIGDDIRGEFTALGLDVNLAARVQDLARDGNTIVLTKSAKLYLDEAAETGQYNLTHIGDRKIRSHESEGEIPLYSLRKWSS